MNPLTSTLTELASAIVDERQLGTAIQLYVSYRGQTIADIALGSCGDSPVHSDSLHPVYCLTKPIVAVAIAQLAANNSISFSEPIASYAPAYRHNRYRVTIGDVLVHQAGLTSPPAMLWRITHSDDRAVLLREAAQTAKLLPAYSELSGWAVLCDIIEAASGLDAEEYIHQRILAPLDLDRDIILTSKLAQAALAERRIRVPVGGLPLDEIPLLAEMLPDQLEEHSPAFGGLASMSGMGRFYVALGQVMRGETIPGMPTPDGIRALLEIERSGGTFDETLNRHVFFRGGFMSNLAHQQVCSGSSPAAIGHSAGLTNSVAFTDPAQPFSLAVYINGSTVGGEPGFAQRHQLVDTIFHHVTQS